MENCSEKRKGSLEPARRRQQYLLLKRCLDMMISFCGIVLLLPLLLGIAALVGVTSRGPILFAHDRVGENGRKIAVYKFRTMVHNAEEIQENWSPEMKQEFEKRFKLEQDPRITKVGSFLRRTSLDELPQLFNVLRGEMSLVGPRPITREELHRYGGQEKTLLSVRPGMTGYWQICAERDCTYEQRMEMELFYVENASLRWDMILLFATVKKVLGDLLGYRQKKRGEELPHESPDFCHHAGISM